MPTNELSFEIEKICTKPQKTFYVSGKVGNTQGLISNSNPKKKMESFSKSQAIGRSLNENLKF